MSYVVTAIEVLYGFSTSASTEDVEAYIAVTDQADDCLTANNVPVAIGKQLKILAVRHLASIGNEKGSVREEQSVSGARRVFMDRKSGETNYLEALRSIDQHGCVLSTVNKNVKVQLRSVGRFSPHLNT